MTFRGRVRRASEPTLISATGAGVSIHRSIITTLASRPIADEGPVVEVKPEPAVKSIHPEHVGNIDAGEISGDELAVGEASTR